MISGNKMNNLDILPTDYKPCAEAKVWWVAGTLLSPPPPAICCIPRTLNKPIDDSSYRQNVDLDKENEIHYPSCKEHLKMSKIAKFGCEML